MEKANPGIRLRFFSERVFGAWVDGRIVSVNRKRRIVTIAAEFHGAKWRERVSRATEFYRPADHPQRGEPFRLE